MADVTQSLFGITPESLMAAREQQMQEQAMKYATLDPYQKVSYSASLAGDRLGSALGGLLGAEDPELMRVRQRQQLLQGINPADPASLRAAAQKAMEANDFVAAQAFADRALAAETAQAKLTSEQALANQRNRERQAASLPEKVFAALAAKATPASVKAAQDAGNDVSLLQIPENVKVSTYGQVLKDAGFVEGTPEFQSKMKEFAAAELEGTKKGKGTTVDIALAGRKEFTEKLAGIDVKQVEKAIAARENASTTIRSLDQLAALDDQGLISGSFATGRVGATNLLNTLGLASPADQQRLASSQNYQKVAGDVILGVLGGKLGAGFSNEDRKFIEGLVPQLETSPLARRQLINFMRRKNMDILEEAVRLENYARDNETLKGFKPKIPLGANVPVSGMSADDLARAAGGKIVNGKFVPNK